VNPAFSDDDRVWMQRAFVLARQAEHAGEVPVGALLVSAEGTLLAEGHNQTICLNDPSAHAEIQVLRAAGRTLGNYRLLGTVLYVSLEPCAMCAMALVHARVARVVYAASDPKTGACGSVFDLLNDPRHNHRPIIQGGLYGEQASQTLSAYFKAKRRAV
jgi:tRNA(adenine34) deaminase